MAVLFIGLDNFKPVNDSFGRRVGDLLLQTMAQWLRAAVASLGKPTLHLPDRAAAAES